MLQFQSVDVADLAFKVITEMNFEIIEIVKSQSTKITIRMI
jgi:hypothetical protein